MHHPSCEHGTAGHSDAVGEEMETGGRCARHRDRLKPHREEIHDSKGTVGDEEITQAIEDGDLLAQEERGQHWFSGYVKFDHDESAEKYHRKRKREDDTRCVPRLLVVVSCTQEYEKREDSH